jgi:psp operon transcriptional activator
VLARHFASRMAFELGREPMPELTKKAQAALMSHLWPGNVRELKNVVERAVYKNDTHRIDEICFDPFENPFEHPGFGHPGKERQAENPVRDLSKEAKTAETVQDPSVADLMTLPLKTAVQTLETLRVKDALKQTRFHQKKAAAHLGLTYDQFRGIKKRLEI